MTNPLKEIGMRLTGLREALELSTEEFAKSCNIPLGDYLQYESGDKELTVSTIRAIANKYNVDLSVLLFADEPRMTSYYLTRKGKGLSVKRVHAYKYQTLAGGFNNRKSEIFEVTVEPNDEGIHLSSHNGQEFNHVLEGRMKLLIDSKELILEAGDSIYYDSKHPHGMKALDGKSVRFIAVVL